MNKIYSAIIGIFCICSYANASSVIATINGTPITDTDVNARIELMAKQGNTSLTNRKQAFQNIVNDYVKLNYAANFNVKPTDKDADKELAHMNLGSLSETTKNMARLAVRSDIAWGVITARTIIPTIKISENEIKEERIDLIRERGLPIETTIIRLTDIPNDIAKKLKAPKNCDNAEQIAEEFGGFPQKITAMQYELSPEIRERIADLPLMTWSQVENGSVVLVCKEKKTKEYANLDEIIKQNATYKKAAMTADQQLKQLRRKAVIIINDDRYKL
ncbi:MAG: hypothetical protein IKZ49_04195 [Alphaproteobacteria bacterium]|nr:hypothetical protein [Alphaproteobacteria bacterium]